MPERKEQLHIQFKGREQLELYDELRSRAFLRKSTSMSGDMKSICYFNLFKKKLK